MKTRPPILLLAEVIDRFGPGIFQADPESFARSLEDERDLPEGATVASLKAEYAALTEGFDADATANSEDMTEAEKRLLEFNRRIREELTEQKVRGVRLTTEARNAAYDKTRKRFWNAYFPHRKEMSPRDYWESLPKDELGPATVRYENGKVIERMSYPRLCKDVPDWVYDLGWRGWRRPGSVRVRQSVTPP